MRLYCGRRKNLPRAPPLVDLRDRGWSSDSLSGVEPPAAVRGRRRAPSRSTRAMLVRAR
jgi:hypothetical protein